jgi:hypothetical protein
MGSPPFWRPLLAALVAAALLSRVLAATEKAYVMLLYGDEFVLGVRVLGNSICNTGTRGDMAVLVSDGVSASSATAKVAAGVRLLRRVCDRQARRRRPPNKAPFIEKKAKGLYRGFYLLLFYC